jgi:hypothetical protein
VRPNADSQGSGERPAVVQADHGRTMIHSTAARVQEPLRADRRAPAGRAFLVAEGKRMPVSSGGALIGRSRECDIVLQDANVSRRHAELRPAGGGWAITDLGSTNGVRVNGVAVGGGGHRIEPGDRLEIGTVDARFEVE